MTCSNCEDQIKTY